MSESDLSEASTPAWRVTWTSLLRTIRAPFATLVLAAIGLLVPPQTADMLAALEDGRRSIGNTILFQLALALLALSAWYWSRALLAARFDVPDNAAARRALPDVAPRAYDLVPRLMYVLAVLLGLGIILRSGAWSNLAYLLLWAVPLGVAVYFRTALLRRLFACLGIGRPAEREAKPAAGLRSTGDLCAWVRSLPRRLGMLIQRAPWPNWVSVVLIAISLAVFVWGALDAFVPWPQTYPELAALAADVFPGPAVALVGLALIIAPLSVLTFLFDGLDISVSVLEVTLLRRPPVMTLLVAWVLIAPTLFSLHTVRIVTPTPQAMRGPDERADLGALFVRWVEACAPGTGPVRPIIVAISGGASRAAIWGERVLFEVEQATGHATPRVFAVSSVSGGSLGVAAYMAALAAMDDGARCTDDAARHRRVQVLANHELSEDALGPLLAGALLVDIPRALFTPLPQIVRTILHRDPRGGDRAEALERAFEHLWRRVPNPGTVPRPIGFAQPYLSLFYAGPTIRAGMPLWIANGTDMASGSRLVTVPFSPRGDWPLLAAADVLSALGADVRVSTAINNTARFPYLEPAGELLPYTDPAQPQPTPLDRRHQPDGTAREILDGGYFENEGLQTALELAAWLARAGPGLLPERCRAVTGACVVPIIVQATADGEVVPSERVVRCQPRRDDPTEIAQTRRPLQLLAPVFGLYNVRGGHSAVLLREARAAYCPDDTPPVYQCDVPSGLPVRCVTPDAARQRFFHFYLPADGSTPVPLNWTLSDSMARFIWEGAMQAAGNPEEAWIMRRAMASP